MMEQAALTRAMGLVWDQGNAAGLDGWIGPGRGSGEVDDEAIRLRQRDIDHYLKTLPGRTEKEIRDDQRAEDLALHLAFRPEVVAEVAVHLSEESDWEAIAKWCGGIVDSGPDGTDSGEWVGWIVLPDKTHVFSGMWIVQRHDLTFAARWVVAGPSDRTVAQVKAEALREAAVDVSRIDPQWDSALYIDGLYEPIPDWLNARADELENT